MEDSVHKLWDKFGLQKVFLQDKGLFIFKFSAPEERVNVLALRPWYVSNKLFCLKRWKEGMDFQSEACSNAPVWVKFHNVPLSYLSASGLSYLASGIGKPLSVDKLTKKLEPMNFARMCVELSSTSAFPSSLDVIVLDEDSKLEKVVVVKVEYQNRPQLCSHCKTFWHSLVRCPSANYKWVHKAFPQVSERVLSEPFGEPSVLDPTLALNSDCWTTVTKGPKLQGGLSALKSSLLSSVAPSCNPFNPISPGEGGICDSFSDTDGTPLPNPLVEKLK